jgi:hypothetical protein
MTTRRTKNDESSPIARLRETIWNRHILRGFGPLVAAIALFVLMVVLVPTVARERETVVETPAPAPTATATPGATP